jgi:c-di-GMP-binding flagellar brake protein YcgR
MTTNTLPMALDALAAALGELDDFRVSSPTEVHALLKRLLNDQAPLYLNTPKGEVYTTKLWTIDPARGSLGLGIAEVTHQLHQVLDADEVTAVGYLDRMKVQFELSGLVLVHATGSSGLSAQIPREMFRFQRRNHLRVRSFGTSAPTAFMTHPRDVDRQLALRVVDLSMGGCALFLPQNVPPIEIGTEVSNVQLELDSNSRLRADIVIRNLTPSHGTRLGCEFASLSTNATRTLQLFVDHTASRGRMVSLGD